jgi:hypothetical protein
MKRLTIFLLLIGLLIITAVYYSIAAEGDPILSKSRVIYAFNLHDPDDTMDNIKKQFPLAMTITKVTMKIDGGTNLIGRLYEVDGDGDPVDQVGIETGDWTVTTTETEDTSFNNATLDAGDYLSWDTTSVSGSVVNFVITVEGRET